MNAHTDIFSMTTSGYDGRAIARRQVHAQTDAMKATRITPVQPVAMIEGPKPRSITPTKISSAILECLTEPKSAQQIAKQIYRSENCVLNYLRTLRDTGYVTAIQQPPIGTGKRPQLWVLGSQQRRKVVGTRDRVLDAITGPMTQDEIATATNLSKPYVREIISSFRMRGLVANAGKGPKPAKGVSPDLWVRT